MHDGPWAKAIDLDRIWLGFVKRGSDHPGSSLQVEFIRDSVHTMYYVGSIFERVTQICDTNKFPIGIPYQIIF